MEITFVLICASSGLSFFARSGRSLSTIQGCFSDSSSSLFNWSSVNIVRIHSYFFDMIHWSDLNEGDNAKISSIFNRLKSAYDELGDDIQSNDSN